MGDCRLHRKENKSFKNLSMDSLLDELEEYVFSLKISDFDYKMKIQDQQEILGYVNIITNKQEDRRKLFITDVVPLKNKETNAIWAYAVYGRSTGSGKTSRYTIKSPVFNTDPIHVNDIIYANDVTKNPKGYWYIINYYKVV